MSLNSLLTLLQELRVSKSGIQETAWQRVQSHSLNLCQSSQTASDDGDLRGTYEGVKEKKNLPITNKIAPLKSKNGDS